MTQCERIIDYMDRHDGITTLEAFRDLGVTRLASRIHDIERNYGYDIKRETVKEKNRFGEPVRYTRYSLAPDMSDEVW